MPKLILSSKPIGKGSERACFIHPEDPRKAIKIPFGKARKQTVRDIRFYTELKKRTIGSIRHIPDYHGLCDTNAGRGIVVDLIRNYDGEFSRPLSWYLLAGVPIEEFDAYLEELKQSFLEHLIICNRDLNLGDLLVQKTSMSKARLVAIDGFGDASTFEWMDRIPFFAQRKIRRRWKRFHKQIFRSREVRAQRERAARIAAEQDI